MNFALLLFSVIMIKVIKYKQKRVQKMKRFIKKRWKLEWMTEFLKPEPDQEKLTYIEYILECIDPLEYDQRLERGEFYCEHLKRRNVQKRRRRKKYLSAVAKVAVFVIMFIISAQVICYAITGKSIFRYLDQIKEETTTIDIDIHDSDGESIFEALKSLKNYIEHQENGQGGVYKNKRVSSWKEIETISNGRIMYPRNIPKRWKLTELTIQVFGSEVGASLATYEKGNKNFYYTFEDCSGEDGSTRVYFGEKRKKVKVVKHYGGEFYIYKGKKYLSAIGNINKYQIHINGDLSVKEVEDLIHSIK